MTRNLEIGNNPVYVLPNMWRLGQVGSIKFGTNFSNDKLLNAARVTAFTVCELLGKNQQGGVLGLLRLNHAVYLEKVDSLTTWFEACCLSGEMFE